MEPALLATAERIAAHPDHTAAMALAHLAVRLAQAFDENLQVLMVTDEAEPVHKARVALRRFRVAIAAFEPVLDDDVAETLHHRSRALFRILGAIRDSDVMAMRFVETDRAEAMQDEAMHQRRKGRRLLKKKKAAAFNGWVAKRLAGKSWRQSGKKAKTLRDGSVAVLATAALDKAWALCGSNGADLRMMSARAQHDLRKDLKALRYLSEFFADLWPGPAQDVFLQTLRALQDDLGELTDTMMAKKMGHLELAIATEAQARAAEAWVALLAQGPWWDDPRL